MWLIIVQAARPPAGAVEVAAFPAPSTATQRDTDGHETPFSGPASTGMSLTRHAPNPLESSDRASILEGNPNVSRE